LTEAQITIVLKAMFKVLSHYKFPFT